MRIWVDHAFLSVSVSVSISISISVSISGLFPYKCRRKNGNCCQCPHKLSALSACLLSSFGISRLWSRCDIEFDAVLMRHSNCHRRINLQPIVMFEIVKNQMWIPPSAFAYHAWWQLRAPERSSIGRSMDQVTAWQLQFDDTSLDWRLQHSLTINVEQCGCLSTAIMQSCNWEREQEEGELETASHRQVELGTSFILIIISSGILAPPFDACCGRFVPSSSSSSSSSTDWIT